MNMTIIDHYHHICPFEESRNGDFRKIFMVSGCGRSVGEINARNDMVSI